jgi:hypothetical protein
VSCDVGRVEVFMMEAIDGWCLAAAQAVALGDREVDLRWVDVAELVEVERRFVAEDTLDSVRPEGCLAIAVQRMNGERV